MDSQRFAVILDHAAPGGMEASLEGPCGRQRSRQEEVCHSKEQAHRVNLIATRYQTSYG
jgi:hypothetical protein